MKPVVKLMWTEYERGWGQRPDGSSLHLTNDHADEFEKKFLRDQHGDHPKGYVPACYSQSSSRTIVDVDEATYRKIEKSMYGIWE